MAGKRRVSVELKSVDRERLEAWCSRRKSAHGLARRARIVLLVSDGVPDVEVARMVGVQRLTVAKWRLRFAARGLEGLLDEPRPGAPRKLLDADIERVVTMTLEEKPKDATHWSLRSMARASRMSVSTVGRIWGAFGLQPHRSKTFKLSADPQFVEKVRDVVGLYLNPPDNALVLCVDEKSQIQALDRTAPLLPLRPGHPETGTHDYARHGTVSLFAALNTATGKVIGQCRAQHRSVEFRDFLEQIDRNVPAGLDVHLVLDNLSTHKTPLIHRWLLRHDRFQLHFTPTSSSWLNQVERWFAMLTDKQLRRGVHRSTRQLVNAIVEYLERHNENAKPFRWTKNADEILAAVARFCLHTSGSGH